MFTILRNLKNFIPVLMVAIACGALYLSYVMYGKYTVQKERYDSAMQELRETGENLIAIQQSCLITEDVTTKLISATDKAQEDLARILSKLPAAAASSKPFNVNGENDEKIAVHSRAGVDDDLIRLLDDAYCNAVPDDSHCTAR